MSKRFLILIVLAVISGISAGYAILGSHPAHVPQPNPPMSSPRAPESAAEVSPIAPSNLTAEAVSQSQVKLHWFDNSNNEEGFRIYRDNNLLATVGANVTTYQDTHLEPATTYQYVVKAYNQAGESGALLCTVRTPNPPITVTLERIGVYDNGESWLRELFNEGEVYLYIVVYDGKKTTEEMRFPQQEGKYYELAENEIVDIGAIIFSTDEVGDSLTITAIGYENDGDDFELFVYEALTGAMLSNTGVGGAVIGSILEAFGISMEEITALFFGYEDDFLGAYEQTWNCDSNWGVGTYTDIACEEEDGTLGLRLWFTIENPMEPLTVSPPATPTPPETPSAPTPSVTPEQFRLITKDGIQVACPEGWEVKRDWEHYYSVEESDTIGISVTTGSAGPQEDYDTAVAEGILHRTTVGGYLAYVCEGTHSHDDKQVKRKDFYIVKGDKQCVISYSCDLDKLEDYEPIFEYVLDSFKFLE